MKKIFIFVIGIGLALLSTNTLAKVGDCNYMQIYVYNNTTETWVVTVPPMNKTSTIHKGDKIAPGATYYKLAWSFGAGTQIYLTTKFADATGKKSFIVYWNRGFCFFGRAKNTSHSGYVIGTNVVVKPLNVARWSNVRTYVTILN